MQHLSSKKYEHLMHVSELFDGHSHLQAEGDRAALTSDEVKAHLKNWALIGSALRGELPAKFDPNFADKVMARLENEQISPVHENARTDSSSPAIASEPEFSWVPPVGHQDTPACDEDLPSLLQKPHAFSNTASAQSERELARERALSLKLKRADELMRTFEVVNEEASESKLRHENEVTVNVSSERTSSWSRFFSFKRLAIFTSQVAIAASVAVVAIVGLQTYNAADPVIGEPGVVNNRVGPVSGLSLASYQNSDNAVMMDMQQMPEPNLEGQEAYQSDLERKQKEELERINLYVQGYVLDTAANR